jgi:hypothetical protein
VYESGLVFSWLVRPSIDDPVWHANLFSTDRSRLLAADVAMILCRIAKTRPATLTGLD